MTDLKFNFLSLGAGRQSTALALMAAHGHVTPMPDAAIFADTGDEPTWVYETVRWLQGANVLPFPVLVTSRGRLSERLLAGDDMARVPFHVGAGGMAGRQCTRNYKIRPIRRAVREFLGIAPRGYIAPGTICQWVGLSYDETWRIKPSGVKFMINRWPLIELGYRVGDCEHWLRVHDYPVPRSSACVYCPYLSNAQRREIKEHDPIGHQRALKVDRELRLPENVERFHGELYVHSARRALSEIDLSAGSEQGDLFVNECEGICGV